MATNFDKVNKHFIKPILQGYYLLFYKKMKISERKRKHLNYRSAHQYIFTLQQPNLKISHKKNIFRRKLQKYFDKFYKMYR